MARERKEPMSLTLGAESRADLAFLSKLWRLSKPAAIAFSLAESARKARADQLGGQTFIAQLSQGAKGVVATKGLRKARVEDVAAPAEPPPPAAPAPKKRRGA